MSDLYFFIPILIMLVLIFIMTIVLWWKTRVFHRVGVLLDTVVTASYDAQDDPDFLDHMSVALRNWKLNIMALSLNYSAFFSLFLLFVNYKVNGFAFENSVRDTDNFQSDELVFDQVLNNKSISDDLIFEEMMGSGNTTSDSLIFEEIINIPSNTTTNELIFKEIVLDSFNGTIDDIVFEEIGNNITHSFTNLTSSSGDHKATSKKTSVQNENLSTPGGNCNLNSCMRFQKASLEMQGFCTTREKIIKTAIEEQLQIHINQLNTKLDNLISRFDNKMNQMETHFENAKLPNIIREFLLLMVPPENKQQEFITKLQSIGPVLNDVKDWMQINNISPLNQQLHIFLNTTYPDGLGIIKSEIDAMSTKNAQMITKFNNNLRATFDMTRTVAQLVNNTSNNTHGLISQLESFPEHVTNVINAGFIKNKNTEISTQLQNMLNKIQPLDQNLNQVLNLSTMNKEQLLYLRNTILTPTSGLSLLDRLKKYDGGLTTIETSINTLTQVQEILGSARFKSSPTRTSIYEFISTIKDNLQGTDAKVQKITLQLPATCDLCTAKCGNEVNTDTVEEFDMFKN